MPRVRCCFFVAIYTATVLALPSPSVVGQTIWTGLTKTFTKAALSDGTLPENQDHLTDNVVLTRLASGGLINIAGESFYDSTTFTSPIGTKWATNLNNPSQSIAAANWQNLSFANWIDAYGGNHTSGGSIAGRDAVVFLVADNVYLDLKFADWTAGAGGGYSYLRAEPPATPTPTGDYNLNGVVDAADYVVWRDTLAQSVSPLGNGADGNANGTIDSGDHDFWRARFGNIVMGSAAGGSLGVTVVPEPAAAILLLLGLLAYHAATRRKR